MNIQEAAARLIQDKADLELGRLVRKMPKGWGLEHENRLSHEDKWCTGTTGYEGVDSFEYFDTPEEALQKAYEDMKE